MIIISNLFNFVLELYLVSIYLVFRQTENIIVERCCGYDR